MKTLTFSLFTRTPLHVGCGSSVGVVDLPVLRERATGFPTVPGSALKGVLRDLFTETQTQRLLFGASDERDTMRGKILVGEARLTAFPVRSAKGGFAWLTSPLTLDRRGIDGPAVGEDAVLAPDGLVAIENDVVLEEYRLKRTGDLPENVKAALKPLCGHKLWQESLENRLAVVSDTVLTHFAQNACEIAYHNRIDDTTGTVANGALFAQENVPSETLFVGQLMADDPAHLAQLIARLTAEDNLLQVGADATTGLGWCTITCKEDVQ